MKHTEKAFAKINLYLNVTARRADGFHDVESVMQEIDVYDLLHFEFSPADETKIELSFSEPCDLPTDERNLIVRAAKAFLTAAKKSAHIKILLEKKIPMAAGLAGGSADAAATLRALNVMLPDALTKEDLIVIAASLGSDIPFCLLGGRALCTGRGEILERLPIRKSSYGVLANTEESSSTPKAYGALDILYSDFDMSVPIPKDLAARGAIDAVKAGELPPIYNIFEDVVFALCPKAKRAKALMLEMDAEAALMSGSGPSVFCITSDRDKVKKIENALIAHGYRAQCFSFVGNASKNA